MTLSPLELWPVLVETYLEQCKPFDPGTGNSKVGVD